MTVENMTEYSTAVSLAAQAALECISTFEAQEYSLVLPVEELNEAEPIKEEKIKDDDDDLFQDEEEEQDEYVVTTYKGRFQCPRPNCSKLYKNRNGLKYHLQKGSCRILPGEVLDGIGIPTPSGSSTSSPAIRYKNVVFANDGVKIKPFWCRKCPKRYKNLNGLKYHSRVEHPEFDFEEVKGLP